MLDGIIGFVLGLFFGLVGGFVCCALAVAASNVKEFQKTEENDNDWK